MQSPDTKTDTKTDADAANDPISVSPLPRYVSGKKQRPSQLRRVQRVSRHAALHTKQQLWDSNDVSIDAAVAAVDYWENVYSTLKGLALGGVDNAQRLYHGLKEGATRIDDGLLGPIRDWILLPAFSGMERATTETILFLESPRAHDLAIQTLETAESVPVVGRHVLAPSILFSTQFLQRSWQILQYPIPSRQQVRQSVDWTLTSAKWTISSTGKHVYIYLQQADANITRTLMHTQWKVLGSGPYATLDKHNKGLVVDHFCERYFMLLDDVKRYELALHIRQKNPALYHDLVVTGLLQQRGGNLTVDDVWLTPWPIYRHLDEPFLIPEDADAQPHQYVGALWFRLKQVNGKRPNDQRWECLEPEHLFQLEDKYQDVLRQGQSLPLGREHVNLDIDDVTAAKWYVPDADQDVMLDANRRAVTLYSCCPSCRKPQEQAIPPFRQDDYGEPCRDCQSRHDVRHPLLGPPPIGAVERPTLWRFHGPGDEIRRATWIIDTPRHGLQPFDEAAQTILEDAYLFLKYNSIRRVAEENALLTVEVPCPDGTDRLVQFSSLTSATAIQKGMIPAIAIFKRNVYRGAWLLRNQEHEPAREASIIPPFSLGETIVPDAPLRSILVEPPEYRMVVYADRTPTPEEDLAVPPDSIWKKKPTKKDSSKADHLVLVVHGIGEMMRSIDVFGLAMPNLASIVDCCGFLRDNHEQVQEAHFAQMYPTQNPTTMGRVEYLPVEWHEAFSILSQRRNLPTGSTRTDVTMKDISLRTIPNMREFANDTLMDVLYFMSPEHHDMIVSLVTEEMQTVVNKFSLLTGFEGRVSIMGHSLGSIIAWDILAHQKEAPMGFPGNSSSLNSLGSLSTATMESVTNKPPEVTTQEEIIPYPQLDFEVDNFFLLGSPVAVFLMIRNQRKPLTEDYSLPGCRRVFNIFHPYDPVAYRIEPCIDPRNSEFEPVIMKHWNGGFRVQYQTKRLWKKFMDSTWKTQQNVVEAFEASMAGMGLLDTSTQDVDEDTSHSEMSSDDNRSTMNLQAGQLNQARRIDFMLQEREIETANEYVSALAAHSSYWTEKDLSLFIARQISLSTLERTAAVDEFD